MKGFLYEFVSVTHIAPHKGELTPPHSTFAITVFSGACVLLGLETWVRSGASTISLSSTYSSLHFMYLQPHDLTIVVQVFLYSDYVQIV